MNDLTSLPKSYYGAGSYVPGPPPSPVPVGLAIGALLGDPFLPISTVFGTLGLVIASHLSGE